MFLVLSATALASPLYPLEIRDLSGAPCEPACTVCHESNLGGSGSVNQPFGEAMMARGLTGASDTDALAEAYSQLVDDAVDSDADGTSDAEALASGLEPNTGAPLCDVVTPTFGCLSHSPGAPGAALVGLLAVFRRRPGSGGA